MSKRDPKQLILDAALSTFGALGFEHTTTGHILARAGISNGALFHHFPTKDAIAEALYLRGIASYQQGLLGALERHRSSEAARAMIKAAVYHHLAWVESNRELARFMYERGRPDWQPAHGIAVRKLNRSAAMHVRDWIAPLAAAGVIRDLPLAVLAACVIGPAHFVARRWLSGLIAARPTSFADALAEAAWAALAPSKPRRSPAPVHRISPAALVETTALDAACGACSATSPDDWTIIQLAVNTPSQAAVSETVRVQSIRMEGDSRIAIVEVDLIGADGGIAAHGNVVCLRRSATTAAPAGSRFSGDKSPGIGDSQ